MAGGKTSAEKLNRTLLAIVQILRDNGITDWMIGYGTLLGLVRESSCIHNDDDVDILCNRQHYDELKRLLQDGGFELVYNYGIGKSRNILKTKANDKFASVDIYMAEVEEDGSFSDLWTKVVWSSCYVDREQKSFVCLDWQGAVLQLPDNSEEKLLNRYGDKWRVPQRNSGPKPQKRRI